ncbi:cytokinesis protein 2 [Monosporozyma unispora]|nr:hypothetical protein C6P44_004132 [Kazachstania unispora]
MSFDFKSCFWDPHDDGVNILLQHISQGIKSISTLEQFFKTRAELSKDYARRLGAIDEKLNKDLGKNPDFGHLNDMLHSLSSIEKARANAFSKQCEFTQGNLYHECKLFGEDMRAKYTTLTGKIENLRRDKFDKRKGCDDLAKRLKEAEIKYRDYKLNENNIIGSKRVEQNNREIIKWETNVKEISTQLTMLKHEYKASQRYWLKEWAIITEELQDMECERISFIQTKLAEFTNINMETSILEQTKLDYLNNELSTFTPMDDISKFSNDFGTGRLKEKHQHHSTPASSVPVPQKRRPMSYAPTNSSASTNTVNNTMMSKRESYMENIRQLSNQLQKTSLSRKKSTSSQSSPYTNIPISPNPLIRSQTGFPPASSVEKRLPIIKQRSTKDNRYSLHESQLPSYSDGEHTTTNQNNNNNLKDESQFELQTTSQHNKSQSESSTTSSSSNPTDFTSHLNRRRSIESMSTSVTSMASSIDDNQRFAKSWNSTNNRKRKSMSHIASYLEQSTNSSTPTTETKQPPLETRTSSTNTILMKPLDTNKSNRRKSMVTDPTSRYPIDDALLEMNKLQGGVSKNSKMGRVNDNGIIVTLPIVTNSGNPVIKYAKALYPLLEDSSSPEVINFDKNDYLLITEEINSEWFLGEVYENERIHPDHRVGLIPFNFIEILD